MALYPHVLYRAPITLFWVWINLLPFNINNQCRPLAIVEDRINKPWRTMPSGRLSARQAKYSMILFYHVAILTSWMIGGLRPSLALIILGFWYNRLGGADSNGFVRNLINALGFTCFGIGSLELTLNQEISFDLKGFDDLMMWIFVVATVVLTTVHVQDMSDQVGDALINRKSLPLQIGDGPARWSIIGFMSLWSVFCPYFWRCGWFGYTISTPLATLVSYRSYKYRTAQSDKITYQIWNIWMASLYFLPLIGRKAEVV
ncbi:UbiA prenyltransferase family [Hypoxylon trugodes]|uniref:UbiA prenyltransferase family n=1 Tax=Hypoxylon trugodes TaxID=326681 RepID=UPI00219BD166|nr:UbiA prenyltransferase family [Hypoxylon trugodes]KAI1389912.1 UbiA prenyltransferase family [Hypoxylon trugodes]